MTPKSSFHIRAITDIWTGDENRRSNKLRETGIIGSMRWWYEAIVRALGGFACDPVSGGCVYEPEKINRLGVNVPREQQICPACELFGCTGWSRKFRLRLLNSSKKLASVEPRSGREFYLELLWLKKYEPEEHWLLTKSIEIAAKYGSVGGKTALKPQAKASAGKDYGLIEIKEGPPDSAETSFAGGIEKYLSRFKPGSKNDPEHPDLRYFFFLQGNYLKLSQLNQFLGCLPNNQFLGNKLYRTTKTFMRGARGDSKKVFSFRQGDGRIWGYARDESELKIFINVLKDKFGLSNIRTGKEVIASEL